MVRVRSRSAAKRNTTVYQNHAQEGSKSVKYGHLLTVLPGIFHYFHPFHSQLFSPQQWLKRTCLTRRCQGLPKRTQFITRPLLRLRQRYHDHAFDQILNHRNEGPPFQAFRWEILVCCKGMKTDRLLNVRQHGSNRSFTTVEATQNKNSFHHT